MTKIVVKDPDGHVYASTLYDQNDEGEAAVMANYILQGLSDARGTIFQPVAIRESTGNYELTVEET